MTAADFIASGILEAYALGTATPDEAVQTEQMMALHPEVEAEYQAISKALEDNAEPFHRAVPGRVWSAISQAIHHAEEAQAAPAESGQAVSRSIFDTPTQPSARSSAWQWATIGIAAVLLLSLGFNYYLFAQRELLASQLAATERSLGTIAQTTSNLSRDKEQLVRDRADMEALLAQALRPTEGLIRFGPMPAAPRSHVMASYDRTAHRVALRGTGMPVMDKSKVVQLWAIVQGKPVSLGLAEGLAHGRVVMADVPDDMGEPEAFALSLETDEAHATPQGPLLAMGKVL